MAHLMLLERIGLSVLLRGFMPYYSKTFDVADGVAKKQLHSLAGLWYNARRLRKQGSMRERFQFWWWRDFGFTAGAQARVQGW